ncbi:hypothetical protein WG908_08160 [Sphingobium sp. AN641]|uniref:hypothetical protein n=1 Tax=Sphingobium sp. AN641 TaxID=3133443 RepID=UPI0030C1B521
MFARHGFPAPRLRRFSPLFDHKIETNVTTLESHLTLLPMHDALRPPLHICGVHMCCNNCYKNNPAMPPPAHRHSRRAEVVEADHDIVAEQGPVKLAVRQVAAAAGIQRRGLQSLFFGQAASGVGGLSRPI